MGIIKQHEIENTVRFSIYSSTKEFGSTGKRFDYKVSIVCFKKYLLICRNIFIDGPSSCRTIDILSQFKVPIESLRLGVLIPRSIINCRILNNKSTIYSPEYTNMPTLPHWPTDPRIIMYYPI